ncbi:MAG TPA: MEDS domain-containing protein [Chryseosolibacter sp.]|nr:MEDS domain-containing protein [Chryseosolibacter sp.]
MDIHQEWKRAQSKVFWSEIAPCDHVVQIYDNDDQFLNILSEFVADGMRADDCVILIVTHMHMEQLTSKLSQSGIDIEAATKSKQLIALDAEQTLSQFMVNGWPDETRFTKVIGELLHEARLQSRQVRAFGEMVAILWAKGFSGATVQLEALWNKFIHQQTFTLFCAYPRSGFTENATESMLDICKTHTKVISAGHQNEVLYKTSFPLKAS